MDASKRLRQLERQADALERRLASATLRGGSQAVRAAVFGERGPRRPTAAYKRFCRRVLGKTPAGDADANGPSGGQLMTETLTESRKGVRHG